MTTQSPRAARILRQAAEHAKQYDGAAGLAQEVGFLRGAVEGLAVMVDQANNVGVKPSNGCALVPQYLDDADVLLEVEYERGEAQTSDGPGYPASVTLCSVFIGGIQVSRDAFGDGQIAKWEQAGLDLLSEAEADARDEDRAERARDRQLEEVDL